MGFFKDFAESFTAGYAGIAAEERKQERELERIDRQAEVTYGARARAEKAILDHQAKLEREERKQRVDAMRSSLGLATPAEMAEFDTTTPKQSPMDTDASAVDFTDVFDIKTPEGGVDIAESYIPDTSMPAEPVAATPTSPQMALTPAYRQAIETALAAGDADLADSLYQRGLQASADYDIAISKLRTESDIELKEDTIKANRALREVKNSGYKAVYAPAFINYNPETFKYQKNRAQKKVMEEFQPDATKYSNYKAQLNKAMKLIPKVTFTTGTGGLEASAIGDKNAAELLGIIDVLTVENFGGKLGVGVSDADVALIKNSVLNARSKRGARDSILFGLNKLEFAKQYADAAEEYADINGTTSGFNKLFAAYRAQADDIVVKDDGGFAILKLKGSINSFDDWLDKEADKFTTDGVLDTRKLRAYTEEKAAAKLGDKSTAEPGDTPAPTRYKEGTTFDDLSEEDKKRLMEARQSGVFNGTN